MMKAKPICFSLSQNLEFWSDESREVEQWEDISSESDALANLPIHVGSQIPELPGFLIFQDLLI